MNVRLRKRQSKECVRAAAAVTYVELDAEPLDSYLDATRDRIHFTDAVEHNVDCCLSVQRER